MAKQKIPPARSTPAPTTHEVVDPRWLLKMLGILLVLALLCGYLTLGLLFYLGSWQLAIHPTRLSGSGTALPSQHIRFAPDSAGTPQLSGEWLPAPADSTRKTYAVLYLRSSDGQLDPADGTQIAVLNGLGLSVLAFDYRGFGESAPQPHPTEANMLQDATSASDYLIHTRNIPAQDLIVFGAGTGVSIASQLMEQQHLGAALIAYNADPEVMDRVNTDPRSHLFPMALVFHNRFPLIALQNLKAPKLLYTIGPLDKKRSAVYQSAADPKTTVEVPTHNAQLEHDALARFLDANIPATAPVLTPEAPIAK